MAGRAGCDYRAIRCGAPEQPSSVADGGQCLRGRPRTTLSIFFAEGAAHACDCLATTEIAGAARAGRSRRRRGDSTEASAPGDRKVAEQWFWLDLLSRLDAPPTEGSGVFFAPKAGTSFARDETHAWDESRSPRLGLVRRPLPRGRSSSLDVGGDCASKSAGAVTCGVGPGGSGRCERCHGLLRGTATTRCPSARPTMALPDEGGPGRLVGPDPSRHVSPGRTVPGDSPRIAPAAPHHAPRAKR